MSEKFSDRDLELIKHVFMALLPGTPFWMDFGVQDHEWDSVMHKLRTVPKLKKVEKVVPFPQRRTGRP